MRRQTYSKDKDMRTIRIVPVLDVKRGYVVHAVSGQREHYEPYYDSYIVSFPDPERVLRQLAYRGFSLVYIADIDAIDTGKITVRDLIHLGKRLGLSLLVDIGKAGIYEKDDQQVRYVIGTEYLTKTELDYVDRRVMSLDMYGDKVKLADSYEEPSLIIKMLEAKHAIPDAVLILRLDIVGTESGVPIDELRIIVRQLREMGVREIYYGGGVRGAEDIVRLCDIDVDGVIVGTAVHRGRVDRPYILCGVC